ADDGDLDGGGGQDETAPACRGDDGHAGSGAASRRHERGLEPVARPPCRSSCQYERKNEMTALIIIAIALALLAGFIATRPSEFQVARSTTIAAPPSAVFTQVNELRKWKAWSPWAK